MPAPGWPSAMRDLPPTPEPMRKYSSAIRRSRGQRSRKVRKARPRAETHQGHASTFGKRADSARIYGSERSMADLPHDASGLASSEPAGVAAQQTSQPASSDKGKLRVFISYSRDDLDFADQLDAALDLCGFECLIDRHGISGGEDWKRRLGNLISEADEVVFVLSPHSARSEICAWEVEEAAGLNKRILPIICRPLEGTSPPPRLRDLNYIYFYKEPKVPGS